MNFSTVAELKKYTVRRPSYGDPGSAGMDICAYLPGESVVIKPNTVVKLRTGLAMEIPKGFYGLLVPRSSAGCKWLELVNTVGVIDSSYRGEILIIVRNHSDRPVELNYDSPPIAHLIIQPYMQVTMSKASVLSMTKRGTEGFVSTYK